MPNIGRIGQTYTPPAQRANYTAFAFTSPTTRSVTAPATALTSVTATSPDGSTLTYFINGGAQAALFQINTDGTGFSFKAASTTGTKVVDVGALAANGNIQVQTITVTVA